MNIDPVKRPFSESLSSVERRDDKPVSSEIETGISDEGELDNITQQNLLDQVRDMPEVRTEVTEIGRKLADDPNYPSDEAIDQIASLMIDLDQGWVDSLDTEEDAGDEG